jgi:hypothetical protein
MIDKPNKFTSLPEADQERAKQLFLEGESISSISTQFNVARSSLSYHANKHWKKELDLQRAELFSHFTKSKRANFIKMSESAIRVMTRALEDMAHREIPPTIREAKDATVILESLDKITRLDDGNPTDIVAEKPISITSLKEKLMLDPFYKETEIEEVEFKEFKEDSEEGSEASM